VVRQYCRNTETGDQARMYQFMRDLIPCRDWYDRDSGCILSRDKLYDIIFWLLIGTDCVFACLPTGCREEANCRYKIYLQAKNQVFRSAGATRCTDSCQIWHSRRARWLYKILPQWA